MPFLWKNQAFWCKKLVIWGFLAVFEPKMAIFLALFESKWFSDLILL